MHNRNRYCGSHTFVKREQDQITRGVIETYVRGECKRYSCPYCGEKKAQRVMAAITTKAVEFGLQRMLTLTLDPSKVETDKSVEHIKNTWAKFRTYLKRKYGKAITFIAVLELQKSRMAHLHILVDKYLPQAWISLAWEALGGGRIVHIKFVDVHKVGKYLGKYLTKDLLSGDYGRIKRYTCSRDIRLFTKSENKKTWRRTLVPIDVLHSLRSHSCSNVRFDKQSRILSFQATI